MNFQDPNIEDAAPTGPADRPDPVEQTYDRVAEEYARRISDELKGKPLDTRLLNAFARRVRRAGPVYDLGCGPGHVARHLHERGVDVAGIDLSAAMVDQARTLNPGIPFHKGDIRRLDLPDGCAAGFVSFYSIIHFDAETLGPLFAEWRRVLRRGGPLLLAFHIGGHVTHLDEWWGQRVAIDFRFFDPTTVTPPLSSAGFDIVETIEREPYPDVEHPSRRAYILAEAN